jgi:hypothetical protein
MSYSDMDYKPLTGVTPSGRDMPAARAAARRVLAATVLAVHQGDARAAAEAWRDVCQMLDLDAAAHTPAGMCGCGCGSALTTHDIAVGRTWSQRCLRELQQGGAR